MRTRVGRRSGVALAALIAVLVGGAAVAVAEPVQLSSWVRVPGPAVPGAHAFIDVKSFGATSSWAVGVEGNTDNPGTGLPVRPLTARWDGRAWTKVTAPNVPGTELNGVSGTSGTDVWAVGGTPAPPFGSGTRSVVLRWNGTGWTEVPHVAATEENPLTLGDVAAVSRNDVWAVGFRGVLDGASPTAPHAQHWDGVRWTEVKVPDLPGAFITVVTSVSAAGPNNVFAAGWGIGEAGPVPYFIHWNGAVWTLLQQPPSISGVYSDIEALGGGNFVAVGTTFSLDDGSAVPAVASRSAGVWRQEAVPVASAELNGVTADAEGQLWAVGDLIGEGGEHDTQPLLLTRTKNGSWSVTPSPVTEPGGLRDVDSVPGTPTVNVAVGSTGSGAERRGLILSGPQP